MFLPIYVVQYRQINAGTLALIVARSGAKLEKTSLSAGGSKTPAYDIVYIAQLYFGNNEFRYHLILENNLKYVMKYIHILICNTLSVTCLCKTSVYAINDSGPPNIKYKIRTDIKISVHPAHSQIPRSRATRYAPAFLLKPLFTGINVTRYINHLIYYIYVTCPYTSYITPI